MACGFAALSAGCYDPAGDLSASWFEATITRADAPAVQYSGPSSFVDYQNWDGTRRWFRLNTHGAGDASGHRLRIHRRGVGRPSRGTYVLGPPVVEDGREVGFIASYTPEGDCHETFIARSGTMVITLSTRSVVDGTFQFTGVRRCSMVSGGDSEPHVFILPGAPEVEVTGSFRAVRAPIGVNEPD